jgi:hypothetical protein
MFSVLYTEDIVRGRNNLGTSNTINNITEVSLRNQIKEMSNKHGKPQNIDGLLIWSNGTDTFSFSIFKEGKPFRLANIQKDII